MCRAVGVLQRAWTKGSDDVSRSENRVKGKKPRVQIEVWNRPREGGTGSTWQSARVMEWGLCRGLTARQGRRVWGRLSDSAGGKGDPHRESETASRDRF